MKKFDVHIKVSFPDWFMVEAETPEQAKEKVMEMFITQSGLDWITESLEGAKQDGHINCEINEIIEL